VGGHCGAAARLGLDDDPEEPRQRSRAATCAGPEVISNRLDLAGQVTERMERPRRDLLTGRVELDECYVGGLEEGLRGPRQRD
jgi:hypothetical protein